MRCVWHQGAPRFCICPLNRVGAGSTGSVRLPEAMGYLVPRLLGVMTGRRGPLTGLQPYRSSSSPGRIRLPGLNSCLGHRSAVAILGKGIQPPSRGGIHPLAVARIGLTGRSQFYCSTHEPISNS